MDIIIYGVFMPLYILSGIGSYDLRYPNVYKQGIDLRGVSRKHDVRGNVDIHGFAACPYLESSTCRVAQQMIME